MKKIFLLVFSLVLAVSFMACKSKVKPGSGGSQVDPPPQITVGKEMDKLYRDMYTNLSSYVATDSNFDAKEVLTGDFNDLKNKILVYQDKGSAKWVALGIGKDGQNVFLGISEDANNVADAVLNSSKKENWDPRKLFFTLNNGNVRLSWAARVGKPNNGVFIAFSGFQGLDGLPNGFAKEYTLVDDYEQVFFGRNGWWDRLSAEEKATHKNGNSANFIMEKNGVSVGGSAAKRKAWLWDFWSQGTYEWYDEVKVRLAKPENIRFGYAEGLGDYYPGGVGGKEAKLTKMDDVNDSAKRWDTRAPNGKTVFTRFINNDSGWNYDNNQAVFLATVVGYNVRMKTVTPKDLNNSEDIFSFLGTDWNENTQFQIVVMEFDDSTYQDARYDKWDNTLDAPQTETSSSTSLPGSDTGAGSGGTASKYYRVSFIVVN